MHDLSATFSGSIKLDGFKVPEKKKGPTYSITSQTSTGLVFIKFSEEIQYNLKPD